MQYKVFITKVCSLTQNGTEMSTAAGVWEQSRVQLKDRAKRLINSTVRGTFQLDSAWSGDFMQNYIGKTSSN